jgi:hypothetical protein
MDALKNETIKSVEALTERLYDGVNRDVSVVHKNQQLLAAEADKLSKETTRFAKQTTQWVGMYSTFNESLKELGDVANWSAAIESEMNVVAATLERVIEAKGSSPASAAK